MPNVNAHSPKHLVIQCICETLSENTVEDKQKFMGVVFKLQTHQQKQMTNSLQLFLETTACFLKYLKWTLFFPFCGYCKSSMYQTRIFVLICYFAKLVEVSLNKSLSFIFV